MNAEIDEQTFVLIKLYDANTETEQIKTICELDQLQVDFCLGCNKNTCKEFRFIL